MDFLEKLVETNESEFSKTLPLFGSYEDFGFRMFKGIHINEEIYLSIQGSFGHYCIPRKTIDVKEYEAMELAVLYRGNFVNIKEVTDNKELIDELEEYYDTVYSFVPVELIEKLYQDLKSKVDNN